jgi:hypothetical protein
MESGERMCYVAAISGAIKDEKISNDWQQGAAYFGEIVKRYSISCRTFEIAQFERIFTQVTKGKTGYRNCVNPIS